MDVTGGAALREVETPRPARVEPPAEPAGRLTSLDVFRGATMLFAIGVLVALLVYVVKWRVAPASGPDNVLVFALVGGAIGCAAAVVRDCRERG